MEPPWDGGKKVCSNGPGHLTKMATMPIYGQKLGLRTGSRFLSKTGICGSIDTPNRNVGVSNKISNLNLRRFERFFIAQNMLFSP